ncbi:flagellar hook-associated protein FlgL [Hathewaya limosa]|uniref:Flagellar hook-associated protein 3 FlgL n=1 Tax=Hathewaya limosa TaxID=1536 RepID=A0ABU0JSU2_HATLI|nr:flagellar hook-associated protein FlgL [Hathewaya limosa]MDQ0479228.1 flagellar hook-associated protein 3 FlgL [Hathewaya limosa]
MRITNKMLSNSFLNDVDVNLNNLKTLQQQLTSGKEIKRPSDDPFRVARAMQLHTDIGINKQYNKNIEDAINFLDVTDTALGQVTNVVHRVRELLVTSGNGAYGEDEKKAIRDEINQKVSELGQILNSNFDGKYIFAGTRATTKPITVENTGNKTTLDFNGRSGTKLANPDEEKMLEEKLTVEISQGVVLDYNITAKELLSFKDKNGKVVDVRDVLGKVIDNLNNPKAGTGELNVDLDNIDNIMENLLKLRSEVGSKQNRMESARDKNKEQNFNLTKILSKTEDIDVSEKYMEYAVMQSVYLASLQTSSKILQPTLMDYLR